MPSDGPKQSTNPKSTWKVYTTVNPPCIPCSEMTQRMVQILIGDYSLWTSEGVSPVPHYQIQLPWQNPENKVPKYSFYHTTQVQSYPSAWSSWRAPMWFFTSHHRTGWNTCFYPQNVQWERHFKGIIWVWDAIWLHWRWTCQYPQESRSYRSIPESTYIKRSKANHKYLCTDIWLTRTSQENPHWQPLH